jgi:acetyl-CoA acetyltransferase
MSQPFPAIPHGAYWSTPFVRWQGSFAHLHSLRFAAHVARQALAARGIDLAQFDHGALGLTVPQRGSFYGLPWLSGEMGAPQLAGPTLMQACATSARLLAHAARELAADAASCVLTIAADRVSNGPHIYYPNPRAPGGTGETEDWVLANFARDPYAACAMVETAERCAAQWGISTAEQHDLVLRRYAQYEAALKPLADGRTFQQRYMTLPFAVPNERFDKTLHEINGDEGVQPSTAEGLARLRPVVEGGTVTYGGQTHPADGNAGMVVTTAARARELGCHAMADECLEIADNARNDWMEANGGDDAGYRANGENVQRSRLRVETRMKLLGKWLPKVYGDKTQTELSGSVGVTIQATPTDEAI